MAKKQLKKLNQPKKYLQGGSNMGSVSMMRQNPYYIGQVNQDAAEEDLANAQEQLMQAKQTAVQNKRNARDIQNQQLDETFRNSATNLMQSAATDKKEGRLGKLFSRGPLSGQAAMNISAGTQLAPEYVAPATTTVASNVGSLAPGAVEVGANLANTSTNVVSGVNAATAGVPAAVAPTGEFVTQGIAAGAKGAAGMSALTSGLIGVAGNIAGTVIKNKTNDNSDFTATNKEATGNIVGSGVKSAATGFVLGNMFVPGVGGAIGAGIGAGIGALKAHKENQAAREEAQRLQRELAAQRGAYQSAFVNSRLTGADTGFGLNSSTNMNNDFTNQYQVAKTGGVTGIQEDRRTKKVPGGKIVPIEGTDAVEFIGRSHERGGVTIDKNTEVEGGETMDQVAMNNNGKQDYIFSKYLKLGGKSFAQRHKEILKGGGSQAEIQQLAAMQEKVAGRNPQQVAAYGGFHKYLDGGVKPCPECPPNTVCNPATGECVADEETNNSYDWNATGLEGFKAKQNAAAPVKKEPAKPAGPTLYYNNDTKKYTYRDENGKELMSGYDQNRLTNQMNAQRPGATGFDQQLANIEKRETPGVKPSTDNQTAVATQNGTSNAPVLTQLPTPKFDPKGSMQAWARGESKAMMDKSMAESEAYDTEKKKAMDLNNTYTHVNPYYVDNYKYDPSTGFYLSGDTYTKSNPSEAAIPRRIVYKDGKPLYREPESEGPGHAYTAEAYRESPEDIAALQKQGLYKKKDGDGTTRDWVEGAWKNGKFIEFKDNPAFAVEQGYDVPGYTNVAASITDMAALDAAYDADKITLGQYAARKKELEAAAPKPTPAATVNPGVQPPASTQPVATTTPTPAANTQPAAQTTLADDIDKMWSDKGYVKNADGDWVLPEEVQQQNTAPAYTPSAGVKPAAPNNVDPKGNKLPDGYVWDATLNAPVSVAATSASTNVKGANAPNAAPTGVTPTPPTATTNDGFAAPAKRATSTSTTASTPQTPEEKEAARLAGLPRLFMGASRKVDEATGEVTAYTDKPLMGVGDMAGSRLGTTNNSTEELGKVTNNAYDQAWNNKADNLYTNQKGAGSGALSFSDYVKDRDKIAESNWGKKYGYTKGMSEKDAKAAHSRFEADVHSLFANNPDEMMGYFQYIIDGGDPNTKEDAKNKKPGTYLGKDAEQIRANLKNKGYIDANGQPIAGKKVDGKTMAQYLEEQATNSAVGPIHNALGSYTAERSATKIKLKEEEKKKEEIVQEIPKKYEPCPPGTYRSGDGTCKPVGDIPQASRISGALVAGLGQLIPVGAALANPYKIAPGIMGAAAVKGALMPRVNMNQERASNIQQNVAYKNAVINQNAGPGALAAMQAANTKTNEQMLKIAQQEQNQNRQLAAEEGKLGMQASMFNAENNLKTQMFNKEFNKDERRYRREDILGALDTAAARVAGIIKDDRSYKAQERLATALDETGSYDRFSILEQLNKDAKRKGSPYYGTTETERRRIAAAMHKELNPEGYIGMSEYTKLQEEKAKLQKEKEELEKEGKAKFGGARQYVSRLGQLSGVRATKAKL